MAKKMAKRMSESQLKDFAGSKHKGLPKFTKKRSKRSMKMGEALTK